MGEIETLARAIQEHAPAASLNSDIDVLSSYAIDGLLPRLVVTPTTVEQVAQIVALTNQHDLSLLARGGGSRINVGGLPEQIDVLL